MSKLAWRAVQVFSLLAVATSYIGFVLGLSDFLSDLMKVIPLFLRPWNVHQRQGLYGC
jgi:amino acid permease